MRLKCIKLAGFKSFVDPTTVNFPGNLSAVVGPNGCGKSNIIDAVRWVMGESSAKNLRGESMTDVIFNGSGGRKPVGQASIELVFDNSDGAIGGEYARFAEVSIKRRVTREAQNQYFLNGQKCRRRDITDIFLGTGLGPRSYAIIEQGMISKLIESKPEELRVFIEEAAGISKYKERRRETENRIKRTLENLERLTDIRDELERQLRHLERQAEAANQYTSLKEEERQKKAELQALQWQELDITFQRGAEEINRLSLDLEAVVTEQTTLDAKVETIFTEQANARESFNTIQSRYYAIGADIARTEEIIKGHEDSLARLENELQGIEQDLAGNQSLKDQDAETMAALKEALDNLSPELDLLLESKEMAEASQLEAEEQLQIFQETWDNFNNDAALGRQKVEVLQSNIRHSETVMQRLQAREQKLLTDMGSLEPVDDESEIQMLTEELAILSEQIPEAELAESEAKATLLKARETVSETQKALETANESLQTGKGRLASLQALQQAAQEAENDTLKGWLKDHHLVDAPRVSDRLSVEQGFETAVETVLSEHLQAVCVDGLENYGSVASVDADIVLVTPSDLSCQGHFQGVKLASKVANKELSTLLAGIYIVDSLPEALQVRSQLAAHESLITPEGLWVGANWIKKRAQNDTQQGVIRRKAEIEALQKNIEHLCAQQSELKGRLHQSRQLMETSERESETLQQQIRQWEQEKSRQEAQLHTKRAKVEQVLLTKERLTADLSDNREQCLQEQEALAEARAQLEEAIALMSEDTDRKETLTAEKERLRQVVEDARMKASADTDNIHRLQMEQQAKQGKHQSLLEQQSRLEAQITHARQKKQEIQTALDQHQTPDQDVHTELEVLLDKRLSAEEELGTARDRVERLDASMRSTEQERADLLIRQQDVRSSLEKSRVAAEGLEVQRKALVKQLQEDGFDMAAVVASLPAEASLSDWQQALEKLGKKISRLGAINLAAIDEYKTASERKQYLDQQNEDLENALNTLENAIRKIDRETRAKFRETFDKVNDGIQELFPKVFGGGRAYLELTGEDLLDTGITIMAQPPGKKNSTIHLLSGGEKALTAISLVFSIFRLNPAPFCMLDEVDAPLDDANVGRYARMVEEMSAQVQFIYITHNKIAMEMAQHLLGVTMHEPGVSRMVSVDVEEAAELAAL